MGVDGGKIDHWLWCIGGVGGGCPKRKWMCATALVRVCVRNVMLVFPSLVAGRGEGLRFGCALRPEGPGPCWQQGEG